MATIVVIIAFVVFQIWMIGPSFVKKTEKSNTNFRTVSHLRKYKRWNERL